MIRPPEVRPPLCLKRCPRWKERRVPTRLGKVCERSWPVLSQASMRASSWLAPLPRVPRITHNGRFLSLRTPSNVLRTSSSRGGLIQHAQPRVSHSRRYACFTSEGDPFEARVISSDSNYPSIQSTMGKPTDYRLPTNLAPRHYDLTFKTDLEELKFWGYAIIE